MLTTSVCPTDFRRSGKRNAYFARKSQANVSVLKIYGHIGAGAAMIISTTNPPSRRGWRKPYEKYGDGFMNMTGNVLMNVLKINFATSSILCGRRENERM